MNHDQRRKTFSRYFPGAKGPADAPFKEFELGMATDRYHVNPKAIRNGGDGIEWLVERPKCFLKFHQKNVHTFLEQNPVEPEALQPFDEWADEIIGEQRANLDASFSEQVNTCATIFKEIFGPAVLAIIEPLVDARMFVEAWDELNNRYDTIPENLKRSAIVKRVGAQRYDPKSITIAGMFQRLEDLWQPLIATP